MTAPEYLRFSAWAAPLVFVAAVALGAPRDTWLPVALSEATAFALIGTWVSD